MGFASKDMSRAAGPPPEVEQARAEVAQDLHDHFPREIHLQVQKMIEDTLDRMTMSRAFFRYRDILRNAEKATEKSLKAGTLPIEVVEDDAFKSLVEHYASIRPMVEIGETGNITTPEMVAEERSMITLAGALTDDHVLPEDIVRRAISTKEGISAEQIRAVEAACLSDRRVTVIEGTAGAGKSFTMEAVKEAYVSCGYDVMGTALSWNAAQVLGSSINLDGCMAMETLIRTMDGARDAGTDFFRNPTLLIVDEAGMVGTRMMAKLLQHTQASSQPVKVVLTGDSLQVNPVDAGNALQAIVEFHGTTRIDTIRRQQHDSHRKAVARFSKRHGGQALNTFLQQEALHWGRDRDAMLNMVVRDFVSYCFAFPENSALVLALANDDVIEINNRIRNIYKKLGFVEAREVKAEVTDGRRKWESAFSVGDEVVLRASGKQLVVYHIDPEKSTTDESQWVPIRKGIYNRNFGRIVAIKRSNDPFGSHDFVIDLAGDQPGRVVVNSRKYKHSSNGALPMVHNFATTIYGSQGQTVDKVFMLDSPMMEFRLAYVGMSRHRHMVDVYIDETELHNRLDRDMQKTTPLGTDDPSPAYGANPKEISVKLGRYRRSEMLQRMSLSWSKESLNLTAVMFERLKRLPPPVKKKLDEELARLEQVDPDNEVIDLVPEFDPVYPRLDIARILKLPDPIQEAELVRPSEVDEHNIGQSLRTMPIITPEKVPAAAAKGLLGRAKDLFFGAPPPAPPTPKAPVSNRTADGPSPFSREEEPEFHQAPRKARLGPGEVPLLPLPKPVGAIVDGKLVFDGVPQSPSGPQSQPISDDILEKTQGSLWTQGRHGEPRIVARTPQGRIMARYRLDGTCVVGEGYPPMLMNPRPDSKTPVVIVPGPRELFQVVSYYQQKHADAPAKVPHLIWSAKDIDWKPIARALQQQPVIIMRSRNDPGQEAWARSLEKQLREKWGVQADIRPKLDAPSATPAPTPATTPPPRARRRGP